MPCAPPTRQHNPSEPLQCPLGGTGMPSHQSVFGGEWWWWWYWGRGAWRELRVGCCQRRKQPSSCATFCSQWPHRKYRHDPALIRHGAEPLPRGKQCRQWRTRRSVCVWTTVFSFFLRCVCVCVCARACLIIKDKRQGEKGERWQKKYCFHEIWFV